MNRPLRLLLCSAIAAALPLPALADPVPNALRFSVGINRAGQPFTGTVDIELQFFTDEVGGTPTIAPLVIEDVPVQGGVGFFTADFGAENPLNDEDTWIGGGIRLGESTGAFSSFTRRGRFLPGGFALHAQKVAGGAVGLVQIRSDEVQRRVGTGCSASAAIRQINQDGSVVCETVSGGSGGGSIVGVTAGTGLTGGGSAGVVELGVADGGIGPTQLAGNAVVAGKIAASTIGSTEVVDASLKAVDIDSAEIQRRIGNSCAAGTAIRSVGADGAVTCETVSGGASQAWQLDGNAASAGQFIGTTNALPFEMRVNDERGLRLESLNDPDGGSYGGGLQTVAVVAGSSANQALGPGSLVAGGGAPDFANTASGKYASVLGGLSNAATGDYSVALGQRSVAGADSSLAAGHQANVRAPGFDAGPDGDVGTFVWADSQNSIFQSSGANQFLIRAAGGVGVNTNSPRAALHATLGGNMPSGVSLPGSTTALFSETAFPVNVVLAGSFGQSMALHFLADQGGNIAFNDGNNPGGFEFSVGDNTALPLRLFADGDVSIGHLDDSGAVTVRGNTQVRGDLTVTGTLSATNCCSVPSDLRLKQAIEPIASPLERLLDLHGYRFEYSDDAVAAYDLPDAPQLGFIAQELGEAFPEWRVEDRRGFQSVLLRGFDALLVEAVRELAAAESADTEQMRSQLKRLEADNRALRQRLERIEQRLSK